MERQKVLIVTKTYPAISVKYKETVCTAGLLLDPSGEPVQWIRLYPIRFRYLEEDKRFKRWSIIGVEIERNTRDYRRESYRVNEDSIEYIKLIGTSHGWSERKSLLLPFLKESIQEIKDGDESLGIIRPFKIEKSFFERGEREWSANQKAVQDQLDLLEPTLEIEKIPYRFGYEFSDADGTKHRYTTSDWEIMQLYRNCRNNSAKMTAEDKEKEAIKKVLEKLDKLTESDLYFVVGNLKNHKDSFMIIGLFYPPFDLQMSLF
ncbi:hypothetical protein [Gloeobacter morelensis]|uniref:Uncharacterized protein n=1 Tax=Gloeobacter morelensis MG652769 TaxID=2781736 RepID=A0ABY3PQ43_9CYAN|nr:hypothetical protein [Gloeobacter morelensis]UFP95822.1 hypothetical protein ISF26_06200 [Gloeobacter morelensis MG652769]